MKLSLSYNNKDLRQILHKFLINVIVNLIFMNKPSPQVARQMRMQTVGYILTALGLVVGLAWNEAIVALIDKLIPLGKDGLGAKFLYAGVVTVIIIIASYYIQRFVASEPDSE